MSTRTNEQMWTARVRESAVRNFPPEKLLPDRQPIFVASWIYVFGVATLATLVVLVVSGSVLAIEGPDWWHTSSVGRFFNSLHFWGVQVFFLAMVVHLWGKFLMGSWRGKRRATWLTGALAFLVSVGTGLTGYVLQQNFASQWISTQAKDGFNAVGIGAFFNVLNVGQMLTIHVLLMPAVLIFITVVHILQVRHRGVCPPYDAAEEHLGTEEGAS